MVTAAGPSPGGDNGTKDRSKGRARRVRRVFAVVVLGSAVTAAWFLFGGERAQQSSEDAARARLGSVAAPSSPATVAVSAPLTGGPRTGLYRYRGSGTEITSFPPLTEGQGPEMPATVRPGPDGCWALRIDLNTHHWQEWTYCTNAGELSERGVEVYSRRNFGGIDVENTSVFNCAPPAVILGAGDAPGVSHRRSCKGSGNMVPTETPVVGDTTVLGTETVDVGGRSVEAVHVRYEFSYSGGQTGTEKAEMWVLPTTGLPIRNERHLRLETSTPIGNVVYTEDGDFSLTTMDPV